MAVKSGIPTTVNGVQVGATDFREFAVGAGLPAGITGLSANFPANVAISDAPVSPSFTDEGKYFEILTPITFNAPWAFVIDAFDGIMEQGEMLARISCNFSTTENRRCMGPGMSLRLNPGIDGSASSLQDGFTSGDVEIAGGVFLNGGVANVGFFPISQPLQEDDWIWMRVRKTNNVASPSEDDWQVTAWYGDISDEPAVPDGIDPAPQTFTAPRGLFGMGCTYLTPGSTFTQRIAFLSYSADPDVEPPPTEIGTPTVWTDFPEIVSVGALKPVIASPQFEWYGGTPVVADGAGISPWVDTKPGGGLDATQSQGITRMGLVGGPNQWDANENGIIFDELDGPIDTMSFATPGLMLLSDITLFAVVETTDMTTGCAIIGTTDGINPPTGIYLVIYPDGSVHFIIGKNGALPAKDYFTAPGLFVNGTRAIITARLDVPSGGAIIRVNRVEEGNFPGIDLGSDFWFSPRIGQANLPLDAQYPGAVLGTLRSMPWIAGYASAASDAEIEQMESYLAGVFGFAGGTEWTDLPAASPGTVWANTL